MNKTDAIPFNKPFIVGRELFYISQAVLGGHLAGDGKFTRLCNQWIEEKLGVRKALLTHSCTAALEMCALLANILPGDEVIMPSFTFVSTANAFALREARIRFVDIRLDTLNIDEKQIEAAVSDRTKAIVVMHYSGVACEMDAIMEIARRRGLLVIEDAAQGMLATYKGRQLGAIGELGTYSFHETKNFISGEGGALAINDERFIERAEIIREKGTNRSKFFRGLVDKYTWVDIGSSYLPSEIVAAFLYAQLEEAESINRKRADIYRYYTNALMPLKEDGQVRLPYCPSHCSHNSHLFYLIMPTETARDGLIRHLKERDILAVFHYVPLHTSPMGLKIGYQGGELPVTEDLSARLVRLPLFFGLTREEQDRVIDGVLSFVQSNKMEM
jgi:dTDP-4-amino-4,6-dideoxygalactose transaminase